MRKGRARMRDAFVRTGWPLIAVVLSSCLSASGPTFKEASARMQPVAAGQGRICWYRNPRLLAAAVEHEIKLDDRAVGWSVPGGFFCIDRPTGEYELSIYHWVKRPVKFTLDAGRTRYVRFPCVWDVPLVVAHCYPEVVDEAVAAPEIAKTKQTNRCLVCPKEN